MQFLASGQGAADLAALVAGSFSPVYVRYAYPRYGSRQPFFPALIADDRGDKVHGLDALDWMAERGLLFPRADVVGLGADGVEDQLFMKELDLAVSPTAFAARAASDFPGHPVSAGVEVVAESRFALAPGGDFPARLSAFIPTFQLHADLVGLLAMHLLPAALIDPRPIPMDQLDDYLSAGEG